PSAGVATRPGAPTPGHALPGQPDRAAVLRLRRNAERHPPLERRYGDLRAEHGLVQRDRQLHAQVVAVTREEGMRLHAHAEICVARWTAVRAGRALAGEADALPVAHPRGNLHRQPARLSTVRGGDLDDVLSALVRLGQGDLDLPFDVLPLLRPGPRAGPPSTDEVVHRRAAPEATVRGVPKERAEEIGEVARGLAEGIAAGARRPVVDPMEVATGLAAHTLGVPLPIGPDRVVPLALLGIAEDLVGLIDLLEALLGLRLLVDVRVVLARQLPVGLLDVDGRGVLGNAKGLVVVLV